MIVVLVVRVLVTVSGLRTIFYGHALTVQPFHPDKIGGLRHLRDYALSISYLLAIFGLGIVLWVYITSQAVDNCITSVADKKEDSDVLKYEQCLSQLEELGIIYKEGVTRKINRKLVDQLNSQHAIIYSAVYTNYRQIVFNPTLWLSVVAYFVLAPLTFFGTLAIAHRPMNNSKIQNLRALSDRINEEYEQVYGEMLTGDPSKRKIQLEQLQKLREFYKIAESFPVWPWDLGSLRAFAAAVLSPVRLPIIAIAIQLR